MVCPSCGRETPDESRLCVSCGAPLPETLRSSASSGQNVLAGLVIALIVVGGGLVVAHMRKGHSLWESGIPGRAVDLVIDSQQAREALGAPIRQIGQDEGDAILPKDGGYAQAVVRVGGTKATGKVYVVANEDVYGWRMEAAELVLDGSGKTLDLTSLPEPEPLKPRLRGRGEVDLLPLGAREAELLETLPRYCKARFGIGVNILPPMAPDPSVVAGLEHKVVADRLVDLLEQSDSQKAAGPRTLIAVTARPMEIEEFGTTDAINYWRADGYAVVSLARLEPRGQRETGNPLILPVRVRKVVLRDIGRLYYRLPLSSDPTSVLSVDISRARAVDLMGESFLNANGEWAPNWMSGDPCVSITRRPDERFVWATHCEDMPPLDPKAETWENDLALGLFVQKQTDFNFGRPFPLARIYRPKDNQSRAFGIGTNHSLDIFLVGEMEWWGDLILADGGRVHFRRNWWKPLVEEYLPTDTGSYGAAVLRWNGESEGWSLKLPDGWTMIFPSSEAARRSQQAALTGMYDNQGRAYQLKRDGEGNLVHFATPDGYEIDFRYDDRQRVIQAADNHGRTVRYAYDGRGRLVHVEDSAGRIENYSYDDHDRMVRVENAAGQTQLTNEYDEAGWLVSQRLANGQTFLYRYSRDTQGNIRYAEFLDPEGCATNFQFSGGGSWQSLPKCPAK